MIESLRIKLRPVGLLTRLFGRRAACGHKTAPYNIVVDGEVINLRAYVHQERCPDCGEKYLKETSVRCCLCNRPILVGASVIIYKSNLTGDEIAKIGEEAIHVDGGYVGCLRCDCADDAAGYAGQWTGHGINFAFP